MGKNTRGLGECQDYVRVYNILGKLEIAVILGRTRQLSSLAGAGVRGFLVQGRMEAENKNLTLSPGLLPRVLFVLLPGSRFSPDSIPPPMAFLEMVADS